MLKQITNIWRNNNGTFLFACGISVALVMSILWKFDMIPDFGKSLSASPVLIRGRVTSLPTIVVVTVTSDDTATADVQMQVFASLEMASESLSPIESQVTTLRNGLSEFIIFGLARGAYAGIAYIDTNNNSQIDLAEDGSPAEPFGTARVSSHGDSQPLANGVFEVTGEPTFIRIHLKKPKFPVVPARSTEEANR